MTKIKLCGLSRQRDIEAANRLMPEYIGFVFARKSKRYISEDTAAALKMQLHPAIKAVGVFTGESPATIARLLQHGIIDMAQLHGGETENDIRALRSLTDKPIMKAFRMDDRQSLEEASESSADYILLDAGDGGTGIPFDWSLLQKATRPYFLAGGLTPGNVGGAVKLLAPYAVDVSSGIETGGYKDRMKMAAFVSAVRYTIN